jgi:phosphoglycerol transferase MdoB-like AlkP superfamily enzyme
MSFIVGFTEFYLSPFILAIGLAFLVDGLINYFIIGNLGMEEDRRELGRNSLLWAAFLFIVSIGLFGLVKGAEALFYTFQDRVEVNPNQSEEILKIPNVPGVE